MVTTARRSRFFGRAAELAAIDSYWKEGVRLVGLWGPNGSGKSHLIERCCESERRLVSVTAEDLDGDRLASFDSADAASGVLIVLDDAGDAPRSFAACERWLDALPKARFLVASSQRISVRDAAHIHVGPLSADDALDLFAARARLVRHDYRVTSADRSVVLDLLGSLDRLPRAIEAVARAMAVLTPADLLRRAPAVLKGAFSPDGCADRARARLAAQLDGLAPAQAEALSKVAGARSPFSIVDVEAACREEHAAALLDRFYAMSLIYPVADGARATFMVYEHVRSEIRRRAPRPVDATGRTLRIAGPAGVPGTLVVGRGGKWFTLPDGMHFDLTTRLPLQRLLAHLADARSFEPGRSVPSDDLLVRGWPGDRVQRSSGLHRVHVAIATLRKLGLARILLSREAGYCLDPHVPVAIEGALEETDAAQ